MILISLIEHRNEKRIKIDSKLSVDSLSKIKTIDGRKWSRTLKSWHIPYTKKAYNELLHLFGREQVKLSKEEEKEDQRLPKFSETVLPKKALPKKILPKFIIQKTENGQERKVIINKHLIVNQLNQNTLAAYVPFTMTNWLTIIRGINGRKWNIEKVYWELPYVQDTINQLLQINLVHFNFEISKHIPESIPQVYSSQKQRPKSIKLKAYDSLNKMQKLAITALEELLIRERKSHRTIKSYRSHIIGLFTFYPNMQPSKITNAQLKRYIFHKIRVDQIAETTQGQILNALVAFYKRLLEDEEKVANLFRPKKPQALPNVFSKQEVVRFLDIIQNLKHKTMMILAYSAGLRKSEIINLRKKDILFDRKCIFVKRSKGKKDRYVMLAENAVTYIRDYLVKYEPKFWLFEGKEGGQYGERSIQSVFTNAKIKSGVNDSVTLHGLRHSFATHLVEDNVPLHVVKELLGHNSIKTTEIYLHISNQYLKTIKSPLDRLNF